jgi:hypothetical protein
MKARNYESRVLPAAAALVGLAFTAVALWVCWVRTGVAGPLAVEEEWVGLAAAAPGAPTPFYAGFLVPQVGRLLFWLHGASYLDLRLLSLVATAWSLLLLTRIAGHFGGAITGLCAAGFYGACYGVGGVRYDLAGGHAVAMFGLLLAVQQALAGRPRLGLAFGAVLCGSALDLAGPDVAAAEWLLAFGKGLPCFLAFAIVGAVALASGRTAVLWLLAAAALVLGSALLLRWREPAFALVAVLAALGFKALNRRCAGLSPPQLLMRFVLLFAIFGQFALLAREPATEIPSEAERRNSAEVMRLLESIPGDVVAPSRPFQLWLRGRRIDADPAGATALLFDSPIPIARDGRPLPQTHALPAYPPGQHGVTRKGLGSEPLWWLVRPEDQVLAERIRVSVAR